MSLQINKFVTSKYPTDLSICHNVFYFTLTNKTITFVVLFGQETCVMCTFNKCEHFSLSRQTKSKLKIAANRNIINNNELMITKAKSSNKKAPQEKLKNDGNNK